MRFIHLKNVNIVKKKNVVYLLQSKLILHNKISVSTSALVLASQYSIILGCELSAFKVTGFTKLSKWCETSWNILLRVCLDFERFFCL